MDKLKASSPCAGLLPLCLGTVTLEEMDLGVLTSLSPFGDAVALEAALQEAHGVGWPKPGRALGREGARVIWFGRNEALLTGPAADAGLAAHAAVVVQSDSWAVVSLRGAEAADVLARLVPVDLREGIFKRGHTARTQLGHMNASITRIGPDRFMVLVFRSMAATLVHELKQAMAGVASRGEVGPE